MLPFQIRRMGKGNIFSLFVSPHPGGYPSPRFFPRFLVPGPFWEVPRSGQGGGTLTKTEVRPSPSQNWVPLGQDWGSPPVQDWGSPLPAPWDKLHCGRHTSCGFPHGNFLVSICFSLQRCGTQKDLNYILRIYHSRTIQQN